MAWIIGVIGACCLVLVSIGCLYDWFDFECPDDETPMGYESADPSLLEQQP